MIRLARPEDAEQLYILNQQFNGENVASPDWIRSLLKTNDREIVIVAEEGTCLAGFLCMQLKHSICYVDVTVEITELYVAQGHRRKGLAQSLLRFAQDWCLAHYEVDKFTLLTEQGNSAARSLYRKLGWQDSGEIHMELIPPVNNDNPEKIP